MNTRKQNQFLDYLDASIQFTQDKEKQLILDDRKDDADHLKVKANIFNVFKTIFISVTNIVNLEEEIKLLFMNKLETIPDNWKTSYENAKAYNDVEKILIEEIKLHTVDEIQEKFLKIWEVSYD